METKQFYDRKEEFEILQSRYRNLKAGEMLVFYGRRRVGKTELIKEFIKPIQKNKLYFYVDVIEKQGILDSLSEAIEEQLQEIIKFSDFNDFLKYLVEKSEEKFVLVLDEFQRFLEIAPSFITQLQNYWDQKLKYRKIMILLVGSSMGMIEKIINSRTGALYGRATKIKISPFRYIDFRVMFQELNEEEKIVLYAIFGGTPYYLEKAKKIDGDIHKKILELFLKKGADLIEEPKNLLEYENVRAHAKYNAILQAAASGKQSINEIQDFTGIEAHIMPAYVKKLDLLLDILARKDPILGMGRVGRYCIKDNFFMFWYRFIFPNQTALNLGNYILVQERIKGSLNAYVGRVFEDVCMQLLIAYLNKEVDGYRFDFEDIGTWWDRTGEEIDIVAYNKKAKKILLCEVKWTNEQTDVALVEALLTKAKRISFAGEYKFLFISKTGFTKRCEHRMKEIHALYFDLNEVKQMFEKLEESLKDISKLKKKS